VNDNTGTDLPADIASWDVSPQWRFTATAILTVVLFLCVALNLLASTAHLYDPRSSNAIRGRLAELPQLHAIHEFLANEVGVGKQPARLQLQPPVLIDDSYGEAIRNYDQFWRDFEGALMALRRVGDRDDFTWDSYCRYQGKTGDDPTSVEDYESSTKAQNGVPSDGGMSGTSPEISTDNAGPLQETAPPHDSVTGGVSGVRTPLVEALWALESTEQAAKRTGLLERPFSVATLSDISFTASISDRKIAFIRVLKVLMKSFPNSWMCIHPEFITDFLAQSENDRRRTNEGFADFVNALQAGGDGNPYATLTRDQYSAYETNRLAELKQLMTDASGGTPLSIKEWLPAIGWLDQLKLSPWAVGLGYLVCTVSLIYLRQRLITPGAALLQDAGGLSLMLGLPQPFKGRMSLWVNAMSLIFSLAPLALLHFIVFLQWRYASEIGGIIPSREFGGMLFVDDEYSMVGAAGIKQLITPNTSELFGCAAATLAAFVFVALRVWTIRRGASLRS
jgi:hypothetical protein